VARGTMLTDAGDTLLVRYADPRRTTDDLAALLTPAERERHRRSSPRAARHFLTATVLARRTLAERIGLAPEAVPITRTCARCASDRADHGRPIVVGGPWVSWTHTDGLVVVAVHDRCPVGVDAEHLGRDIDLWTLAVRSLSPAEAQWWQTRPDDCRERAFLALWTFKEAVAKANGTGLTAPAGHIDVLGGTAAAVAGYTAMSLLSDSGHVVTAVVSGQVAGVDVAWFEDLHQRAVRRPASRPQRLTNGIPTSRESRH
jgi:4'-phosphopantetheinyl transferase